MKNSHKIYKMKVTLCDAPPIWRRLSVPSYLTFSDLHVIIQDAMGWLDQHLYEFAVVNPMTGKPENIGVPEDEAGWDSAIISSQKRRISEIFTLENDTAKYMYDYGDNWIHTITLEGIEPPLRISRYPRCTDGKGACPPEDCGGDFRI